MPEFIRAKLEEHGRYHEKQLRDSAQLADQAWHAERRARAHASPVAYADHHAAGLPGKRPHAGHGNPRDGKPDKKGRHGAGNQQQQLAASAAAALAAIMSSGAAAHERRPTMHAPWTCFDCGTFVVDGSRFAAHKATAACKAGAAAMAPAARAMLRQQARGQRAQQPPPQPAHQAHLAAMQSALASQQFAAITAPTSNVTGAAAAPVAPVSAPAAPVAAAQGGMVQITMAELQRLLDEAVEKAAKKGTSSAAANMCRALDERTPAANTVCAGMAASESACAAACVHTAVPSHAPTATPLVPTAMAAHDLTVPCTPVNAAVMQADGEDTHMEDAALTQLNGQRDAATPRIVTHASICCGAPGGWEAGFEQASRVDLLVKTVLACDVDAETCTACRSLHLRTELLEMSLTDPALAKRLREADPDVTTLSPPFTDMANGQSVDQAAQLTVAAADLIVSADLRLAILGKCRRCSSQGHGQGRGRISSAMASVSLRHGSAARTSTRHAGACGQW